MMRASDKLLLFRSRWLADDFCRQIKLVIVAGGGVDFCCSLRFRKAYFSLNKHTSLADSFQLQVVTQRGLLLLRTQNSRKTPAKTQSLISAIRSKRRRRRRRQRCSRLRPQTRAQQVANAIQNQCYDRSDPIRAEPIRSATVRD